jgi:endonuclease YncB( thermonuclease family)
MKRILALWVMSMVIKMGYTTDEITGRVVAVIDGNTLEVVTAGNEVYKIVLEGIDCPEIGQEFGEEAKLHAQELMLEKEITVQLQGKDRKGNHIAIVFVGDSDPRIDLLNRGLAWTSEKGAMIGLADLEGRARKRGMGLWKQENPTPPWIYRRQQSMMTTKDN